MCVPVHAWLCTQLRTLLSLTSIIRPTGQSWGHGQRMECRAWQSTPGDRRCPNQCMYVSPGYLSVSESLQLHSQDKGAFQVENIGFCKNQSKGMPRTFLHVCPGTCVDIPNSGPFSLLLLLFSQLGTAGAMDNEWSAGPGRALLVTSGVQINACTFLQVIDQFLNHCSCILKTRGPSR